MTTATTQEIAFPPYTEEDRTLVRINAVPPFEGPERALRVDPQPAWDRAFERVVFNGYVGGARRVFLADLRQCNLGQDRGKGL